jgi:hypothetical protein
MDKRGDARQLRIWVSIAVISSAAAAVSYALLLVLPNAPSLGVVVAFTFAAGLTAGSIALYHISTRAGPRPITLLAAAANGLAGALFVAMALVQVAIKSVTSSVSPEMQSIYWGLDVAWDLYVGAGTVGFSLAFFKDPWFKGWFAVPGLLIASTLLVFNVTTFPAPPGSAGLIDVGPLVGLWYLAATVRIALLLRRSRS